MKFMILFRFNISIMPVLCIYTRLTTIMYKVTKQLFGNIIDETKQLIAVE